jgi:hypothetical protein
MRLNKNLAALSIVLIASLLLAIVPAGAQPNLPPTMVYARDYAGWQIQGQSANTFSWNGLVCNYTPLTMFGLSPAFFDFSGYIGSSKVYFPIAVTDAVAANSEIVTPTATAQGASACSFTAAPSHSHVSFVVSSGTVGLQEAVANQGGSTIVIDVLLDRYWFNSVAALPGTPSASSVIASITGSTSVDIVDTTTAPWTYYTWNGTTYTPATVSQSVTTALAAPGNLHAIIGNVTTTNASYSNGGNNMAGVRGTVTIPSGTTASAGYLYGTQGKYILGGTVSGSTWGFGLLGQVDISGATLTSASHVGAIWGDAGATGPAVSCTFCDLSVMTNTTATTFNSVYYAYSKANYLMDLSNNGSAFINSSTATGGSVTGYLKIKINGVDAYIAYKGTPGT